MELVEIDSVVTRTENPYIADVAELVKVTAAYKGSEDKSPAGKFTVDNKDAAKTMFYVQQAAIAQGVTARLASKVQAGVNSKGSPVRRPVPQLDSKGVETGKTVLLFKISAKRKENGRAPRQPGKATAE